MSDTKHTPTPWRSDSNSIWAINTPDDGGNLIAVRPESCYLRSFKRWNANRKFIVRACNSHDALLTACINALEAFEYDAQGNKAELEKAIRLAGGQPKGIVDA